ncbi:hypothetical protein [Pseudomonas sp. G(2018)]|uniref:hypothetical protein n=1 Tax=Pseudomonas sp. G(2018) TaxID=2502242 RepID=UPI0010F5C72B|nr:hypothetical protein [Pseudomonas sp. G(2018)]
MSGKWIDWYANGMQLALVVLVVGGIYGWAQQQSAKQDAMCDVALSYVEVLETQGDATRQEIRSAQKVADDACAEPEFEG